MLETAASRYQKVQVSTSSPGQILLQLYNGIFRFLNTGKAAFQKGELARGREQLSKAQAIIHELEIALDHDMSPELCGQLQGLYQFSIDRIQKARFKGETCWIDEVVRVLDPLRDAWTTAVAEVQKQSAKR
jgi:flagellar secretion chaperone FliS